MLKKSDENIVAMGAEMIGRLFAEVRGTLDLSHVTRWPFAVPNTAPGTYKKMAGMKARTDPKARVQVAGDYLIGTGQNSAIYYGRIAAENIVRHL